MNYNYCFNSKTCVKKKKDKKKKKNEGSGVTKFAKMQIEQCFSNEPMLKNN